MVEDDKRLSPRVIESRIQKWAKNRSSYPHLILKAFLNAYLMIIEYNEKGVYRAKMEAHFNNLTNSEPSNNSRFISVFRQMCSASSRAYGDIFIYDRAHESVFLNNQYKDLILSLKDSFLE